jgi:hypothetical protein
MRPHEFKRRKNGSGGPTFFLALPFGLIQTLSDLFSQGGVGRACDHATIWRDDVTIACPDRKIAGFELSERSPVPMTLP